jgi:hypothetical protein
MRKYDFCFTDGSSKQYEAEQDSLHPGGAVVLSKKIQTGSGIVATTGTEVIIVRVISLANVLDYGYEEIKDA